MNENENGSGNGTENGNESIDAREQPEAQDSVDVEDTHPPGGNPQSPAAEARAEGQTSTPGVNPDYADSGGDGDDDGDDFLSVEDVTFQRDSDGELLAIPTYVEELGGTGVFYPLDKSQRERYVEDLADTSSGKDEITDAELAELFDRNVAKPDLSAAAGGRVTERYVSEQMPQYMQDGLYIGVLLASKEMDMIRLLRNELTDSEIRIALAASNGGGGDGQHGGFRNRQ